MNKKYEIIQESKITFAEHELFRIKAIKSFGKVKKGDVGGYIESERNLNPDPNISGDAWIGGDAWIWGNAEISGNAEIWGDAKIWGDTKISGDAYISGNAYISGDAYISGNAKISGNEKIDRKVVCLTTEIWTIIFANQIQIGCKKYSTEELENLSDEEIGKMANGALDWWKKWKYIVLSIAKVACFEPGEAEDTQRAINQLLVGGKDD